MVLLQYANEVHSLRTRSWGYTPANRTLKRAGKSTSWIRLAQRGKQQNIGRVNFLKLHA